MTLWEPESVLVEPGPFALAVADALAQREAEGHAVDAMRALLLGALASQIDALSSWLAARPAARPADRAPLARLLAQFEGTYERATGPVAPASDGGLGDLLDSFREAEERHAEGSAVEH